MKLPAVMLPWFSHAGLCLALCTVLACAAPTPGPSSQPRGLMALPPETPPGPSVPPGPRVIVLLAQDAPDPAALRERLAAVARVPVRVLHPLTPHRWALQLQCDSQAACAAALERLAAERSLVLALEADPPVQLPPRPKGALAH